MLFVIIISAFWGVLTAGLISATSYWFMGRVHKKQLDLLHQKFDQILNQEEGVKEKKFQQLQETLTQLFSEFQQQTNNLYTSNFNRYQESLENFKTLFEKQMERLVRGLQSEFGRQSEILNTILTTITEKIDQLLEQKFSDLTEQNTQHLTEIQSQIDHLFETIFQHQIEQAFGEITPELNTVNRNLAEIKTLADTVTWLKKIFTHVKIPGLLTTVQLEVLIAQTLSPSQYVKDLMLSDHKILPFGVKLPNNYKTAQPLYLPIDAGCDLNIYQQFINRYEQASNPSQIDTARLALQDYIINLARGFSEKYFAKDNIADFGLLFIPSESFYLELLQDQQLSSRLYQEFRVILTAPTTLTALLQALRIGFYTWHVEKRSQEIRNNLTQITQVLETVQLQFQQLYSATDLTTELTAEPDHPQSELQEESLEEPEEDEFLIDEDEPEDENLDSNNLGDNNQDA